MKSRAAARLRAAGDLSRIANGDWQVVMLDAADGKADRRPIGNLTGEAGDEDR